MNLLQRVPDGHVCLSLHFGEPCTRSEATSLAAIVGHYPLTAVVLRSCDLQRARFIGKIAPGDQPPMEKITEAVRSRLINYALRGWTIKGVVVPANMEAALIADLLRVVNCEVRASSPKRKSKKAGGHQAGTRQLSLPEPAYAGA